MSGRRYKMTSLMVYQAASAFIGLLFVTYGMDIRRKAGARDFVAPAWQGLVKLCAVLLIGGFAWLVASLPQPGLIEWLALLLGVSGTAFVVAGQAAPRRCPPLAPAE